MTQPKGKFTDLLSAAQDEKTKERKEEETQPLKEDLTDISTEASSVEDPIVNLNLKVQRSVREWLTISARELHLSNKDLIILAVTEYVEKAKSNRK